MIKTTFLPSRTQSLPVSQPELPSEDQPQGQLRRRLSSLSLQIQPSSSTAYTWALHRSKSLSSMGENAGSSLKKWWEWGWGWILSRKPAFAVDLELNEEEKHFVGTNNKGSWKHVFYKIRGEFRRILLGSDNQGLPLSFRYDHPNSKSFDGVSAFRRSATLH